MTTKFYIYYALTLLCVFAAGCAIGYEQGIRDTRQFVLENTLIVAKPASPDFFEDCEGRNISSVLECYGDE